MSTFNKIVTVFLLFWSINQDSAFGQNRTLRLAFHVFQDEEGAGNFHQDSLPDRNFLTAIEAWVNHKLGNLDTLKPAMPSPFVPDAKVRIRVDSVFYHRDTRAWNASVDVDAPYIRGRYIDGDTNLTYRQKFQTLPVFICGNHQVAGGHTMGIGDKGYIAVRGYYYQFQLLEFENAVVECGKNLLHELGHCLGLLHNFKGGPNGEQCDQCDDNGCPTEGASNNVMDYWPGYGHAISLCQFRIIQAHLNGETGDISEIVVNDSCYRVPGIRYQVMDREILHITDTVYAHGDYHIQGGGCLRVTGYLSIPAGCSVFVGPGGCLQVDGGTVGNLCGELWNGIALTADEEDGKPTLQITNGGCIENARTGIWARGPIIGEFKGALFRNSVKSLDLKSIPRDSLIIRECDFVITNRLNQYDVGITPESFIEVENYRLVEIAGSRFVNEKGTLIFDADNTGTGIIVKGSDLDVRGSEFTNLFRGIVMAGNDPTHMLTLDNNSFIHNRCGVHTDFSGLIRIENNLFRLQRFNERSTFGIRLERPRRLIVSYNRFESVYGAGSMAGLALNNPSIRTGKIAGNFFGRLPIGVFINQPPPVDEGLLEAAADEAGRIINVELGPQLYDNEFIETEIKLALLPDPAHGTAIGYPADYRLEANMPAINWPVGGYAWDANMFRLGAFGDREQGLAGIPEHGFYLFMNYLNLEGRGQEAEGKNREGGLKGRNLLEDQDVWNIIRDNLLRYQSSMNYPDSFFEPDVFRVLPKLAENPAILRSGYLSDMHDLWNVDDRRWLREALAVLAGTFNRGDSLLADLGISLAEQNARVWLREPLACPPGLDEQSGMNAGAIPLLNNLPPVEVFRFQPPGIGPGDYPGYYLWPNPCSDVVYIHPAKGYSPVSGWSYRIFSMSGHLLRNRTVDEWNGLEVSVSDLPAGIYIMSISNPRTELGRRLFIKME